MELEPNTCLMLVAMTAHSPIQKTTRSQSMILTKTKTTTTAETAAMKIGTGMTVSTTGRMKTGTRMKTASTTGRTMNGTQTRMASTTGRTTTRRTQTKVVMEKTILTMVTRPKSAPRNASIAGDSGMSSAVISKQTAMRKRTMAKMI